MKGQEKENEGDVESKLVEVTCCWYKSRFQIDRSSEQDDHLKQQQSESVKREFGAALGVSEGCLWEAEQVVQNTISVPC
jgi:hypothetical protein